MDRNSNRNLLVINACASYVKLGIKHYSFKYRYLQKNNRGVFCGCVLSYAKQGDTNMAVMEINLPSGYTVDKDSLPAILKTKDVKRVDTKNGDSGVDIYFDKV